MIVAFNSLSEAQNQANHWDACERDLDERIGKLQAEKVAVRHLKEATQEWIAAKSVASPEDSAQTVTVDDIRDCRTQREIVRECALRNGGYARLSEIATLVVAAGKAKGKRSSVRSTLNNYCRDSDEWLYHEPGVYRLVETIPPEDLAEALKRAGATGDDVSPVEGDDDEPQPASTDVLPLPLSAA